MYLQSRVHKSDQGHEPFRRQLEFKDRKEKQFCSSSSAQRGTVFTVSSKYVCCSKMVGLCSVIITDYEEQRFVPKTCIFDQ